MSSRTTAPDEISPLEGERVQPDHGESRTEKPSSWSEIWRDLRAFLALTEVLSAAALGLAIFLGVIYLAIGPGKMVPGGLVRLGELGKLLEARAASGESGRDIYLLGSSVVGEGLDAKLIEPLLPAGQRCFNLSWLGATPRELLLVAPAVARARPAMVVVCLSTFHLDVSTGLSAERAAYAAWSQLVNDEDAERLAKTLSESDSAPLRESQLSRLLRLRTLPLGALNQKLGQVSRPDLRFQGYERNFFAPWAIRRPISKSAADRLLRTTFADLDRQTPESIAGSEAVLDELFTILGQSGSRLVLVLPPQHPAISAKLANSPTGQEALAMFRRVAERHSMTLLDQRDVLPEADYAEVVHTYEPGRLRWSWVLGTALNKLSSALAPASQPRHSRP